MLVHAFSSSTQQRAVAVCKFQVSWSCILRHCLRKKRTCFPVLPDLSLSTLSVQCPQSELDAETVKSILAEYKIHNADVTLRSDATADDLIDVVEGNRYSVRLCD
jgi:hypothetical protein